jgi:hypothetical protein
VGRHGEHGGTQRVNKSTCNVRRARFASRSFSEGREAPTERQSNVDAASGRLIAPVILSPEPDEGSNG